MLAKMSRRRVERSISTGPPCKARRYRLPSSRPTTDRSTASATRGATYWYAQSQPDCKVG